MNKRLLYSSAILMLSVGVLTNSVNAQETVNGGETVTVSEQQGSYHVTLKTKTDGIESELGGSLVSTDGILSGVHGTRINLKPTANAGYRFGGYQSFLASGNSTDGLLPIENDSFEISDKTGSVTVYALFEKIPVDPNVDFSDDFSADSLAQYDISSNLVGHVSVVDGRLAVNALGASSIVPLLERPIEESATTGYEIAFSLQQIGEIKQWNTFRIVFKENADGSVYALEFTGKAAFIKKLASIDAPNQSGDKYAEAGLNLGTDVHNVHIIVKGDILSSRG